MLRFIIKKLEKFPQEINGWRRRKMKKNVLLTITLLILFGCGFRSKELNEETKQKIQQEISKINDKMSQDELENMIKAKFISNEINFNDQIIITNIRHQEIINEAMESLEMCLSSIDEGYEEDFFTIDLLNAYEALGEIIGETVDDDVVNEIFSKFCMGK